MTARINHLLLGCGVILLSVFLQASPMFVALPEAQAVINNDRRQDREAIRAHIERIFQSYIGRDCAAIKAAHASNWVGFSAFSTTILRGLDDYMKNSAPGCVENRPPGELALVDYKILDMDFTFYGDIALVPYIAEGVYGKTARLRGKMRSLDVYGKINGSWIQISSHLDLHPETVATIRSTPGQLSPDENKSLMAAREATWRATFSNDRELLDKVLPSETIGIMPSTEKWLDRTAVMTASEEFAKSGNKLLRLEFPRTQTQLYGDVAILYTTYVYELEIQGRRSIQSGRATEIFVRRNGKWVNSGWHLDAESENSVPAPEGLQQTGPGGD